MSLWNVRWLLWSEPSSKIYSLFLHVQFTFVSPHPYFSFLLHPHTSPTLHLLFILSVFHHKVNLEVLFLKRSYSLSFHFHEPYKILSYDRDTLTVWFKHLPLSWDSGFRTSIIFRNLQYEFLKLDTLLLDETICILFSSNVDYRGR